MAKALKPVRKNLKLSAKQCDIKGTPMVCDDAEFMQDDGMVDAVCRGAGLFHFVCAPLNSVDNKVMQHVIRIINMSSFKSEVDQNNVPLFNPDDEEQIKAYALVYNKSAFMIPGITIDMLSIEMFSSVEFQKAVQANGTTVWDDVTEANTFRITKVIIPMVFSMTVQFLVSEIDKKFLPFLSQLAGVPCQRAFLMERTKRNKNQTDQTAKAKSLMLYHECEGGVLSFNVTVVLNTVIPTVVAQVLTQFSGTGASEVAVTAQKTREFYANMLK